MCTHHHCYDWKHIDVVVDFLGRKDDGEIEEFEGEGL